MGVSKPNLVKCFGPRLRFWLVLCDCARAKLFKNGLQFLARNKTAVDLDSTKLAANFQDGRQIPDILLIYYGNKWKLAFIYGGWSCLICIFRFFGRDPFLCFNFYLNCHNPTQLNPSFLRNHKTTTTKPNRPSLFSAPRQPNSTKFSM